MNPSSQTSIAPPPSSVLFARGVIARLAVWATLRIAVQESWGGAGASEKRTWLAGVIVDAFEEQIPTPDDQYVEELLLQVMSDEFEAVIEDGSAESVARDIVKMWDEARLGTQDMVVKFEELADKMKGKRAEAREEVTDDQDESMEDDDEDDEGDDDGSDMDENAPQLMDHTQSRPKDEPEVDEDGFTMVKGKGKGRS